jgi:acyl carrier protein
MGLDGVELVIEVEKRFDVAISDDEASRVRTVGDLHELLKSKLPPSREDLCLTSHAFYRIRSAMKECYGLPREAVRPSTTMESTVPRPTRRHAWKALGEAAGLPLPPLTLPGWLTTIILVGAVALVLVAVTARLTGTLGGYPALLLGLATVPYLLLALGATRPFAVHVPRSCATAGELARVVVASDFARMARHHESWGESELWEALKLTVMHQLGVSESEVTPEARFAEDLKVG